MEKDLIQSEINLWRRKLNHTPSYQEHLKFYRGSKFLSKPFEIFEKNFRIFWLEVKKTTLSKTIPAKSDFDIEGYFKVQLFVRFIDTLRADFDFFYLQDGNNYIINEEKEQLLWDEIGNIFYLPKILLLISGKEEKLLVKTINEAKEKRAAARRLDPDSLTIKAYRDIIKYYLNHKKSSERFATRQVFDSPTYQEITEDRDRESFLVSFRSWYKANQSTDEYRELINKYLNELSYRKSKKLKV